MERITIEFDNGYTVRQGDRYCDGLCYEEALGLLYYLLAKQQPHDIAMHFESWMLTKEQWDARERWRKEYFKKTADGGVVETDDGEQ